MKAAVLEALKQPLQIKELAKPDPGNGEVVVQIKAAALNHRDVWIQKGQYSEIKLPCILGADGAGVVAEIGEGVDAKWKGKEVVINSALNWGDNEKYQSKAFKIIGMPDDGTFAEYIKVPAENIYPKPQHLPFTDAAALPLAGLTAYRAVFTKGKVKAGDKVLITGIGGGVAQLALLFSVAAGAEIYVTSSAPDKIDAAQKYGAIDGANYKKENWEQELMSRAGKFDVIIDGAAGADFHKLIEIAEYGGRIVNYGGTAGNISNLKPQRIFWKQIQIMGSTMGTPSEFKAMIEFVEKHRIQPIVDKTFKLDEINQAMERMEEGKQFGKIVVEIK